jgi:heme oxygenase
LSGDIGRTVVAVSDPEEPTRFSAVLRAATREVHERAEGTAFVGKLMSGELALAGFAELVIQHYFIYSALEDAADVMRGDAVAGRFVIDGLRRVPALAEDLEFLLGPQWEDQISPNAATRKYCDRLGTVARRWPGGFVAHHYTRYLGDISGGQVIRAKLRTHHGITGAGAKFYVFDGIGGPAAFRRLYRSLLDATGWDEAERARVIAETKYAFRLNEAVFAELGAGMDKYLVA